MRGLIHIYCGDGKGKTTAATGLAIRAAGDQKTILFARFLKTEDSSELRILDQIKEISVIHLEKSFGFYHQLDDRQRQEMIGFYQTLWEEIKEQVLTGSYQMLVLDEIMAAINYNIIAVSDLLDFLMKKPEALEVVMTGRDPKDELVETADYVSEIRKIKHPFDQGIYARKGIEY